jgi:hypothetical protein
MKRYKVVPSTNDILAKVCNVGKSLLGIGSSMCIAKPHPPLQEQQLRLRINVWVSEFFFRIHYEKVQGDT